MRPLVLSSGMNKLKTQCSALLNASVSFQMDTISQVSVVLYIFESLTRTKLALFHTTTWLFHLVTQPLFALVITIKMSPQALVLHHSATGASATLKQVLTASPTHPMPLAAPASTNNPLPRCHQLE
jgi:hypothetical protein